MRYARAIGALGAACAVLAGACGKSRQAQRDGAADAPADGVVIDGGGGDGGMTAAALGLTPCRDLSPDAISVVAAAGSPYFLASSPLGASLIAAGGWQVPRTFTGQLGHIIAGAIAPDASWGATIGDDNQLRIWHASDGKEIGRVGLAATPAAVAASPTGDRVAVGDAGGAVVAVAPTTAAAQWTVHVAAGAVGSLHFAPDGKTLLVGTPTGFEWRDAASGDLLRSFPERPSGDGGIDSGANADAGIAPSFAPAAALSDDGARVAYATAAR